MARVIAVANPKGGTGKTTVAVHLAACLAALGRRVLLLDLDPLEHASRALGLEPAGPESAGFLLDDGAPLAPPRPAASAPGVEVAGVSRAALDLEPALARRDDRSERVRRALERAQAGYDLVVVDAPPGGGALAKNALAAAQAVVVPVRCEPFADAALTLALEEVRQAKKRLNPDLSVLGIVLTGYDDAVPASRDAAARVRAAFEPRVFDAVIPWDPALGEAAARGRPAIYQSPASRGAWAFIELAREVASHERSDRGP